MYSIWRRKRIFTVKCLPFSGSPAPPLPSVMSPSRVAASRLAQQGSDLIVPAGTLCTHWLDKALLAISETKLIPSIIIPCFIFLGVCNSGFFGGCCFFFFFFNNNVNNLSSHTYLSGFSKLLTILNLKFNSLWFKNIVKFDSC